MTNISSEVEKLKKTIALRERFLVEFMKRIGLEAVGEIKLRTPKDTGQLRQRWEMSGPFIDSNTNTIVVSIHNPQKYAKWIEDGHKQKRGRKVMFKMVKGKLRFVSRGDSKVALGASKRRAKTFVKALINSKKTRSSKPSKSVPWKEGETRLVALKQDFVEGQHMAREGIKEVSKGFKNHLISASQAFWNKVYK